ncbi:MAG: hypothetical protein LBH20_03645 [Treponema sp.]|nr:hypothetical protein [Treponema sp.]
MDMRRDIVIRALFEAGQELLNDKDIDAKNDKYQLCRAYYLASFLEALTEVEWVGGRKRARLVRTGRPLIRDKRYRFAYDIPYDCARPIELQDNEYFIVEDRLILTDVPKAELLYVSNGRVLRPIAVISAGTPFDALIAEAENEYFTAGPPGTEPDITFYPGSPADIMDELPEDPLPEGDYPDYIALDYEPKFFEYIEKKLAAKFTVKMTEQPRLHAQLLQEAMLIKQEAVDASRSGRAAKVKENSWWADELGLR